MNGDKKYKVLINGLNSKMGGGKTILINLIKQLHKISNNILFYVLTPNQKEYIQYENEFIKIIDIKTLFKKKVLLIITYLFILPNLIKKLEIDLVFNLADLVIPTNKNQIFLFDQSYGVYPESIVWKKINIISYINEKLKVLFLQLFKNKITLVIAQTNVMKDRLIKIYNIKNIKIIPNAISLEHLKNDKYVDFNLPKGIKLLYLTYYYPHKNLEIFLPLAKLIKEQQLNFKIIITLSERHNGNTEKFLSKIKKQKLNDIIINIGEVKLEDIPSLYKQCNGLLMPTLLESFSGTYIEAMYYNLPIFTSDFDFAKEICRDSAIYFNPFDESDILEKLKSIYFDTNKLQILELNSKERIKYFKDWNIITNEYIKVIFNNL